MKLSNPTNVRVPNPSQLENPRMKANTSGPSMKASSPISCGDRKNSAQPRSWRCFFFIAGVTRM